jgi:hypothetical protein
VTPTSAPPMINLPQKAKEPVEKQLVSKEVESIDLDEASIIAGPTISTSSNVQPPSFSKGSCFSTIQLDS